ncbi:hypothetical protein D3C81_1513310 [compost metagenome]
MGHHPVLLRRARRQQVGEHVTGRAPKLLFIEVCLIDQASRHARLRQPHPRRQRMIERAIPGRSLVQLAQCLGHQGNRGRWRTLSRLGQALAWHCRHQQPVPSLFSNGIDDPRRRHALPRHPAQAADLPWELRQRRNGLGLEEQIVGALPAQAQDTGPRLAKRLNLHRHNAMGLSPACWQARHGICPLRMSSQASLPMSGARITPG